MIVRLEKLAAVVVIGSALALAACKGKAPDATADNSPASTTSLNGSTGSQSPVTTAGRDRPVEGRRQGHGGVEGQPSMRRRS